MKERIQSGLHALVNTGPWPLALCVTALSHQSLASGRPTRESLSYSVYHN
jgi:hypothetical protein